MSLAFYASPIDFKNIDLENKINEEKQKINKNMLLSSDNSKTTLKQSNTTISDIHKNLKVENDNELTNFYKTEMSKPGMNQPGMNQPGMNQPGMNQPGMNQPGMNQLEQVYKTEEIYKTNDYLLINENQQKIQPKTTNSEMLNKLNSLIEMFEDQKEMKTGQKSEEIILYCFLGVFIIYIMDSFVNIGKYSR
jgi:hypothetical protein